MSLQICARLFGSKPQTARVCLACCLRLQLWIRLPSRIWSWSSNLERRRTLLPSLDVSEGCATPFGFSSSAYISTQHSRCLDYRTQPSSRSSRRGRAGGQSQYIAMRSSPRPPRSDGHARSGAARRRPSGTLESQLRQAQGRFAGVYGDACRRRSVTKLLTKLQTARSPLNSRRVLGTTARGPLAGACAASHGFLLDFSKETLPWETKRFWSCHLKRWRTTRKPSVNSPLPTTTRGGCSSVQHSRGRPQNLGSTGQVLGLGLRSVLFRSSANSRVPPKLNRVRESVLASATVRDSTHPQKLKDGTYRTEYHGYKIRREWSCSHDKWSDQFPRQLSHARIRCLQPHRLASCPLQQKCKTVVLECHTLPRRQLVTPAQWLASRLAVSQPTGGLAAFAFSRSVTWQCNRFAALVSGNPLPSSSATETLTTRWGSPLLLQIIILLRPSIILPAGSLFQHRSTCSCWALSGSTPFETRSSTDCAKSRSPLRASDAFTRSCTR